MHHRGWVSSPDRTPSDRTVTLTRSKKERGVGTRWLGNKKRAPGAATHPNRAARRPSPYRAPDQPRMPAGPRAALYRERNQWAKEGTPLDPVVRVNPPPVPGACRSEEHTSE